MPCGFCNLMSWPDTASSARVRGRRNILNLCVRPELRCRGIGTLLLEDLLQRAAAAAVDMAYLEVRPSNTAAIRLYQAFEFEHIGTTARLLSGPTAEDAAVFKLALSGRRACND